MRCHESARCGNGIFQSLGLGGASIDWMQVLLIGMTPVFLLALLVEWFYMTRLKRRSADFYWKNAD